MAEVVATGVGKRGESKVINPDQLETLQGGKASAHAGTRGGQTKDAKVELQNHNVQPDTHKMATEILETS